MAAYPTPPTAYYFNYQYPPTAYPPPQSPRRGGGPSRGHHDHNRGYHHAYPVQHEHSHQNHNQNQYQNHQQQQNHQNQQHQHLNHNQQSQQHYPPKYPQHPQHYAHHPQHLQHPAGYPPYQPQPLQGATHHLPWQAHHHQQPLSPLPILQHVQHVHSPLAQHSQHSTHSQHSQHSPLSQQLQPQAQAHTSQPRGTSPAYYDNEVTSFSSPVVVPVVAGVPDGAATTENDTGVTETQEIRVGSGGLSHVPEVSPSPSPSPSRASHSPLHAQLLFPEPQQYQGDEEQQRKTYTQTGTISLTSPAITASSISSPISPVSRVELVAPGSPSAPITSATTLPSIAATNTQSLKKLKPKPKAIWAIWSRRPHDPSHAPGIIISPRARPPPDVVQQALDVQTAPASPTSGKSGPLVLLVKERAQIEGGGERGGGPPPIPVTSAEPITSTPPTTIEGITPLTTGEPTDSTVPSSAASATEGLTDLADMSTVPVSPISSTTSVSLSIPVSPSKTSGGKRMEKLEESKSMTTMPKEEEDVKGASTAIAVEGSTLSSAEAGNVHVASSAAASTSTTTATPPVKKSWASLLKQDSSSSSSTSSGLPIKNSLPTSNVVGISIPASSIASSSSSSTLGVPPGRKAELVSLLTTGPFPSPAVGGNYASAAASAGGQGQARIKPRGLINSGNMCFANSVLQMLVYTPPFQRLFTEIGRLRGPKEGKEGSTTPLVDAMIEFVREFLIVDDSGSGASASSGMNGANSSTSHANGWGKGKEKERERESGEDELWGGESFIPGYVYEAMKEKKRFDNMRGGQQEDAEEFLGFLLETLEEELVLLKETLTGTASSSSTSTPGTQGTQGSKPRAVEEREEAAPPEDQGWQEVGKKNRAAVMRTFKSIESPMSKIFGGKFRTTLRVPFTKKDSVIVEDWRSVRLDIQRDQIHTVQDALAYISHPQPVQVTHPARPGTALEAQQQVHIEALPPVLILHMKRFCYDTNVAGVVKVGKQVTFGPELEIPNDVVSPGIRKGQPPKYKLFGALHHHGLSASGGHYTLDVLHPSRFTYPGGRAREGWIRVDDELVSDVRSEDVFVGEKDESRCAYLLFYRRIR